MNKKIYILDWSGYIFRSYFGVPPLHDANGQNVNCVYGMAKIIIRLLGDKPDGIVVARDSPTKTFRHTMDNTYKANRPKPPEDLRTQYLLVRELIDGLGIPNITAPGYEADDILYTLAKSAPSDYSYYIYTADKDIKQVLTDNIYICDPSKFDLTWNRDKFVEEFAFEPELMVDYLSLIGDVSDNLPWVDGIWPKTAQDLVSKYGSLDNIYKSLDSLTPRIAEKLISGKDVLYRTYSMVQLAIVPDILIDVANLNYKFDFDKLSSVIKFDSLQKPLKDLNNKYKYAPEVWLFG